jgi:gamma-glutamylputrescine oxidase
MNNNFSFWEKESFVHYQYIVIGAGIVGLHTAIALHKKHPQASILVLEKGLLPTGASTKNAGFACMGSATELLADLQHDSAENVLALFAMRQKGLADTRQLLGDAAIGYAENGSYELLSDDCTIDANQLDMLNQMLHPLLHKNAFTQNNSIIKQNKFDVNYFTAAITNNCEGELHTGQLVKALLKYATSCGVEVRTGIAVDGVEETNNEVHLMCHSNTQTEMKFTAQQIIVCTNAFTKTLLPDVDLQPGRGQVLITKPIANLPFKGIYHMQEGYYYFREINNRILFGGGRNLDFATEQTTSFAPNEIIINDLIEKLKLHILPNTAHAIDYTWSGIMAFGSSNKTPIIAKHSNRIFMAVRCGGMGVAIGGQMAKKVVELME